MLRRLSSTKAPRFQRLYSQSASASKFHGSRLRCGHVTLASSAAIATAALVWYSSSKVVHGDESASERILKAREELTIGLAGPDGSLNAVVWGSNNYNVIAPQSPGVESIRTPSTAAWLQNVALRDLALHERHAACVDARGDVYQWGDGFFGKSTTSLEEARKPILTLRGKNITHIALTDTKVFALSSSGRVYVFAADSNRQSLKSEIPTPSISAWYRPGWLLGKEESIDFAEILPNSPLSWREKFVAISAGTDHLLALTSSGRTFAHPITKKANAYGQLGFRKFDIPARLSGAAGVASPARVPVELTPKAILDPYTKSSVYSRPVTSKPSASESLHLFDDENLRFSDTLFEIPGLKGINMIQVIAAGRSSFARTDTGRVLGWGANESGQIGLGGNVTLDTITVPSEIVLWRTVPNTTRSKCLNMYSGGDLTGFAVERVDEKGTRTVDILMCGNGRWGGLGNNIFSSAQGSPLRAKSVSGLLEYSEKDQALRPIHPYALSISPTGHVLMTLDTHEMSSSGAGGRDLLVWGSNQQYQLGNGKRTSVAVPTALQQPDGTRVMLMKQKGDMLDMQGKTWKAQEVEQCAQAGYGNNIVYWKIVQ